MNQNKKREKIYIEENETALNDEQSTKKITEYFESLFNKENEEKLDTVNPVEMKKPFTIEEVKHAVKSLKNNKAPGPDNLSAELIKNSPDELLEKIAILFNNMAKTGSIPEDMKLG